MAPPAELPAAPVRRRFGPTLPALLRERLGLSQHASVALVVGLFAVVALAGAVVAVRDRDTKLVHRGEPFTFNVVITPELRERPPRGDELLRLSGRQGGIEATITAEPLRIPAYGPARGAAYLPLFAERYIAERRRELGGLRLIEEGKQRRDVLTGYQVTYRSRGAVWQDAMLFPDEPGTREGVLLRQRRERTGGRVRRPGRRLAAAARRAFRSFAPGEDRP